MKREDAERLVVAALDRAAETGNMTNDTVIAELAAAILAAVAEADAAGFQRCKDAFAQAGWNLDATIEAAVAERDRAWRAALSEFAKTYHMDTLPWCIEDFSEGWPDRQPEEPAR